MTLQNSLDCFTVLCVGCFAMLWMDAWPLSLGAFKRGLTSFCLLSLQMRLPLNLAKQAERGSMWPCQPVDLEQALSTQAFSLYNILRTKRMHSDSAAGPKASRVWDAQFGGHCRHVILSLHFCNLNSNGECH